MAVSYEAFQCIHRSMFGAFFFFLFLVLKVDKPNEGCPVKCQHVSRPRLPGCCADFTPLGAGVGGISGSMMSGLGIAPSPLTKPSAPVRNLHDSLRAAFVISDMEIPSPSYHTPNTVVAFFFFFARM